MKLGVTTVLVVLVAAIGWAVSAALSGDSSNNYGVVEGGSNSRSPRYLGERKDSSGEPPASNPVGLELEDRVIENADDSSGARQEDLPTRLVAELIAAVADDDMKLAEGLRDRLVELGDTALPAVADGIDSELSDVGDSAALDATTDGRSALSLLASVSPSVGAKKLAEWLSTRWSKPLLREEQVDDWQRVDREGITQQARLALDARDQRVVSAVVYLLQDARGEQPSDGHKAAITGILGVAEAGMARLPTKSGPSKGAQDEVRESIPEPWLSAVLVAIGESADGAGPEQLVPAELSFVRHCANQRSYALRLRHQASMMLVSTSRELVELLNRLGKAGSPKEAGRMIAKYLDDTGCDPSVLREIALYLHSVLGTSGATVAISDGIRMSERRQDERIYGLAAASLLSLADGLGAGSSEDQLLAHTVAGTLRAVSANQASNYATTSRSTGVDQPRPHLLSRNDSREAVARVLKLHAVLVNGWQDGKVPSVSDQIAIANLLSVVLQLDIPLEERVLLVTRVIEPLWIINASVMYFVVSTLNLVPETELQTCPNDVMELLSMLLARFAPMRDGKPMSTSGETATSVGPTVIQTARLLKSLNRPSMPEEASLGLARLAAFMNEWQLQSLSQYPGMSADQFLAAKSELAEMGYLR